MLRCAKARYMKSYNENEDSSFVTYLDNDNLCEWEILHNLSVNAFEWDSISQLTEPLGMSLNDFPFFK